MTPAPLTAEERERFRSLRPGQWLGYVLITKDEVDRILDALDAAEARVADARREALEEARSAVRDAIMDASHNGTAITPADYVDAALWAIDRLAAPRPTEETTP